LLRCKRYYEVINSILIKEKAVFGFDKTFMFSVEKRASPTVTAYSMNGTPNKISYFNVDHWTDMDFSRCEALNPQLVRMSAALPTDACYSWSIKADAEYH